MSLESERDIKIINAEQGFRRAVKVRQSIRKFLDKQVQSKISFANLEKFLVKHLVIVSASFADYHNGKKTSKRLVFLLFMRLFSVLTAIRYMASAVANNELISVQLMADPHYLLGHKRLNSFMLSSAILIVNVMIGGLHLSLELNRRLTVLTFFKNIEQNDPKIYALNGKFYQKFCVRKNLLATYALNSMMFMPNIVITVVYFFGLTIIAYLDESQNFNLLSIVFWNFCKFIWTIDLFSIIMGGFSYYFLSTLFLKYQFKQLDVEMKRCVRNRDLAGSAERPYTTTTASVYALTN